MNSDSGSVTRLAAQQLSLTELSQRILEMATTGVYRESIFETFKPLATKREIRSAIALAKQFGLRSDPALRDADLGTYYQVDSQRYHSFRAMAATAIELAAGEDMAQRILAAQRTLQAMVRTAAAATLLLLGGGGLCMLNGRLQAAAILWMSSLCLGGVWLIQQRLARSL